MEYNKVKRGLEKAAGIVGTVLSIIQVVSVGGLFLILALSNWALNLPADIIDGSIYFTPIEFGMAGTIISTLFMLAISICSLVFSVKVIKSPVTDKGLTNYNNYRICLAVFTAISGQLITMGLIIAVLCLKDYVPAKNAKGAAPVAAAKDNIDSKVEELKHLKDLGVIDDETYKKAIQKIIDSL